MIVRPDQLVVLDDRFGSRSAAEVFGYRPGWAEPTPAQARELTALMEGSPAPVG